MSKNDRAYMLPEPWKCEACGLASAVLTSGKRAAAGLCAHTVVIGPADGLAGLPYLPIRLRIARLMEPFRSHPDMPAAPLSRDCA